jgi:hypothetical protein
MRLVLLLAAAACLPASLPAQEPDAPSLPAEGPPRLGSLRVGGEYLIWWLREGRAPALLTTSSPASAGRLNEPDTSVLYGDTRLQTRHDDRFFGGRVNLEWTDACGDFGLEGRAFFLERDSTYFKAISSGDQLLALPFTNALTNQPDSRIVAGPDPQRGPLSGGFVGYSRIEWFGEEANAVLPLLRDEAWKIDLLAGARFLQMRDRFNQTATSRSLPDGATLYGVMDNYRVGNAFYGGQLGLRTECRYDRFFVQLRGAIALGGDDELVRTFGQSIYQTPQTRVQTASGLYVQPSNAGSRSRGNFDGVGEVAVNVGCQLTRHARLLVGYTFLYWADPLRAADQVDTVVNPQQSANPAPARPAIPFKGDALWAQGLSVGLELQW